MSAPRTVIGWSEFADFPQWGIRRLKAKVDTGARTSALHVENLELLRGGFATFEVVHGTRKNPRTKHVTARVIRQSRVRSSTGEYTKRCFVRTTIRLGDIEKEIEISLVSREKMLFRMLIGRKALEHDFLVDVSKKVVLTKKGKTTVKGADQGL